jgi:hypothetical protein
MSYSSIPGMAGMFDQSFNPAFGQGANVFNPAMGGGTVYRGANAPGGGMGGGFAGGDAGMAKTLQDQWKKAQKANQERFQKMLDLASQFGASQTAAAQDAHRQQLGMMNNSLVSRGLGNSTVRQGVQMTADKNLQQSLQGIQEKKANLTMGVYQQQQDEYPDLAMYLNAFSRPR